MGLATLADAGDRPAGADPGRLDRPALRLRLGVLLAAAFMALGALILLPVQLYRGVGRTSG